MPRALVQSILVLQCSLTQRTCKAMVPLVDIAICSITLIIEVLRRKLCREWKEPYGSYLVAFASSSGRASKGEFSRGFLTWPERQWLFAWCRAFCAQDMAVIVLCKDNWNVTGRVTLECKMTDSSSSNYALWRSSPLISERIRWAGLMQGLLYKLALGEIQDWRTTLVFKPIQV